MSRPFRPPPPPSPPCASMIVLSQVNFLQSCTYDVLLYDGAFDVCLNDISSSNVCVKTYQWKVHNEERKVFLALAWTTVDFGIIKLNAFIKLRKFEIRT